LWRGLGSQHIDHRLHQSDTSDQAQAPLYPKGKSLAEIERQEFILLVGSNIQREQPLAASRLRKAYLNGAKIAMINCLDMRLPFEFYEKSIISPHEMILMLAGIAKALTENAALPKQLSGIQVNEQQSKLAEQLKTKKSTIILGAIAFNHPQAALIRQLSHWIAARSGAHCIYLTEGANSAGAWLAGAIPHRLPGGSSISAPGLSAYAMLNASLKGYFLVNIEPDLDCANPSRAMQVLKTADWVVALSAFKSKSLLEHAQVILPLASFAETAGSFVNLAGEWQVFKAAIQPLEQAKPGWEILQQLGNLFALPDFNQATHDFIFDELNPYLQKEDPHLVQEFLPHSLPKESLDNPITRITEWPLYKVDALVRRSRALQDAASSDKICIIMNAQLAQSLKLKENQNVRIKQGGGKTILPVVIREYLPNHCVWIPAACEETATLGESFGAVEIHVE
jgi:NADH-quinone oxidoreductase subunit G